MEYVIGPVLALILGLKFTDYKTKKLTKQYDQHVVKVQSQIIEQNTMMSNQTIKYLTPLAKSVARINEQLGL